jgi:hypothetical protein
VHVVALTELVVGNNVEVEDSDIDGPVMNLRLMQLAYLCHTFNKIRFKK